MKADSIYRTDIIKYLLEKGAKSDPAMRNLNGSSSDSDTSLMDEDFVAQDENLFNEETDEAENFYDEDFVAEYFQLLMEKCNREIENWRLQKFLEEAEK
uniref:Uncharacterized protein n=1 Tax=Panagrolaimus superbus TaxID=310955 RepID=A0A914YDS3_9BILA